MKAINVEEFAQICFDIEKDQEEQGNYDNALFVSELGKMISTYPTVEVAPVKHGRWEDYGYCSCCGWGCGDLVYDKTEQMSHMSYCPNCGSEMDLKED